MKPQNISNDFSELLKENNKNHHRLLKSLLISLLLLGIILLGMNIYLGNINIQEKNKNEVVITNLLQICSNEYFQKYGEYPENNDGTLNIKKLKNKGILTIDVEIKNQYKIDQNGQIHK